MHPRSKDLAAWLRNRVAAAGAHGLVFELTASVDAAVLARLCQLAIPERSVGVIFAAPDAHGADARQLANHLQLPTVSLDLASTSAQLQAAFEAAARQLPLNTLAARSAAPDYDRSAWLGDSTGRLRMAALYFLGHSLSSLVAGAANRSMLTIGAFTRHGDAGVDLLPLGGLASSDVLALARDLDVPAPLIDGAAAAPVTLQSGEAAYSYADVERYLADGPDAVAPATALKIERLMRTSEHKLAPPAIPDLD
jgi:NAD+ synthase